MLQKILRSKILVAVLLLMLIFTVGVLGYKFISHYTWVDAFYMTVITITTVGYGTIGELDPVEKLFTSLLILSSIFIVGYAIKVISEYVLTENNIGGFKQKRAQKKINMLKNHVIVCGYGRNGKQAVLKLLAYGKPFVIVEVDEDLIEKHSGDATLLFVEGDATHDGTLFTAGIARAAYLICALPSDADNLFIVLSARQINPDLKIISRATEENSLKKMKLAGADNVILPDKIGGDHMANLVVTPDLVEFLDNLAVSGTGESINVEQVPFEKVCPRGTEKAIKQLDVRKKTGCSIIGYKTPAGEYIVNPGPSTVVRKHSKLILIGSPNQIDNLKQLYRI